MTPVIQNLIEACSWSTSHFLIISDNVFSPLLYYSYFGSVIPSVIIALFVFFKGPKKLTNRLLLMTVLCFTAWVFCALVTWATEYPAYTMFFWTNLNILEPLLYFLAFYFFYAFIFDKDLSRLQKIIFSFPLLITFILTPTKFGLLGYNIADCERNAVEGIIATYGYIIEIGYALLILSFGIYFIRKTRDLIEKRKAVLLTIGIIAFLLSFSAGNILEVFTENWYIGQYGLFGAPIFVGFLAYIMIKYKTFNTKIFGAQVLVVAVGILIISMFFVRQIEYLWIVLTGTLLIFIPFGYQLVRSVRREIEAKEIEHAQREQIEKLAGNLEIANKGQENLIHVMNHQIKGFLGKAKNIFAELIDSDDYGHIPDETKPILTIGLNAMEEGVSYVQGILKGASAQSGTLPYDMKPVDIKVLLLKLIPQQKEMAEKSAFALSFESNIAEGNYKTSADEIQITEAFKNLITNAIKYNSLHGNVTVNLSSTDKEIIFSVKDSGDGVSEDVKARLFTAGGVSKDSAKKNPDTSGYGLAFVKGVIEAHKGTVGYTPNTGKRGSTFFAKLPLTHPQ